MLKFLMLMGLMEVVYLANPISFVKENSDIDACSKINTVGNGCTTLEGEPGICVYHQNCTVHTDAYKIGSVHKKRQLRSTLTQKTAPLVCCIASKTMTSPPNGRQKINRIKRQAQPNKCGMVNPKRDDDSFSRDGFAGKGELPWMVSILECVKPSGRDKYDFKYLGGGTLIHMNVVMTAAHIVQKYSPSNPNFDSNIPLYVVTGDYNQQIVDDKKRILKVTSVTTNDNFVNGSYKYDLALLLLHSPVFEVKPMCLPPHSQEPPTNVSCFQSGWGKDGENVHQYILNKVEIQIVERNVCETKFQDIDIFFLLNESFICAEGKPGVDPCRGSAGSPLFCAIDGQNDRYAQWGIVAATLNCGKDGTPNLLAHISFLRRWIDETMGNFGFEELPYKY